MAIAITLLLISILLGVVALFIWLSNRRWKREIELTGKPLPLLPLWATVKSSYVLAWRHRGDFFYMAWCWLGLAAPVMVVYALFVNPLLKDLYCLSFKEAAAELQKHPWETFFYSLCTGALWIVFGASIAVAWHRLILRNERLAAKCYLRFDGVVWNYLSLGILILLINSIPNLAKAIFANPADMGDAQDRGQLFQPLAGVILGVITIYYGVRMMVLLPARALSVPGVTIKDVLHRTRFNFWRIFLGHILCFLPPTPLFFIPPLGCGSDIGLSLLYTLCCILSMAFVAPVWLSFLSLSYRHFFEMNVGQEKAKTGS